MYGKHKNKMLTKANLIFQKSFVLSKLFYCVLNNMSSNNMECINKVIAR